MNLSKYKNYFSLIYLNLSGKLTNKKIIVFESDDWGSIRMPSKEVYNELKKNGLKVDKSPYLKYDTLESIDDVNELGKLLTRFQDNKGNYPSFTLNYVMGNPDFQKIAESKFEQYYYKTFLDSSYEYYQNYNLLDILKQYKETKVFDFQFHSREHVNVGMWLKLLRDRNPVFSLAFDHGLWGLSNDILPEYKRSIQATYDLALSSEVEFLKESIVSGILLFREILGTVPKSFIPNNFIWPNNPSLNSCLVDNGIKYIQGMKYQLLPLIDGKIRGKVRRSSGRLDSFGLLHLIRNCEFEPSLYSDIDIVEKCVREIQIAFLCRKPAIISSHRLNYIGGLVESNRITNLNLLNKLLERILIIWPDVEFFSSVKLAEYIEEL